MHYSFALSAILGCIAAVKAQTPGFNPFTSPAKGQDIKAGQKFDIKWEPAGAPDGATVSIKLLQGNSPSTLQVGPNVASKIPSKAGCFTWAVPRSIRDFETYGFVMTLDGKEDVFQYSFPFDIDNLDNDKDKNTVNPSPMNPNPIRIPLKPDNDKDDDRDDDKDDDRDDDKYDDKDDDKYDDKDDDDHPITNGPTPPAAPKPKNPSPDSKTNNGTTGYEPKPSGMPKPAIVKPSAIRPPASKPSAPVGDKDKGKPYPINVSGASYLILNVSTLIIGIFIALAL